MNSSRRRAFSLICLFSVTACVSVGPAESDETTRSLGDGDGDAVSGGGPTIVSGSGGNVLSGSGGMTGGTSSNPSGDGGDPSSGASSGDGGTGSGGDSSGGAGNQSCDFPAWSSGENYVPGDIVEFEGSLYITVNENPGYDPTISTWFWDPYEGECAAGSGGAGSGGMGSGGAGSGGSGSGGSGTGGSTGDPCSAGNLVWKTGKKTNYESYPDPGSEECIKYNGCYWAGQFAACSGVKTEQWVADHNIAALFPNFGTYELHDICIRSGNKTMVVTVYDTCGDSDCGGCCTANKGGADALIDLEKYTNQRWGLADGSIEWADLGPTTGDGCD